MASFEYNYQNSSLFLFLILIRAIAILTQLGIQNLHDKEKTKGILVVVVKWRQSANLLLVFVYCEASLDTRVFDPTSQRGSPLLPLISITEDSVFIIPIDLRIQIFLQSFLLLLWISRLRGNRECLQFWWRKFEWHPRHRSFWLFFPFTPATRVIHEEKNNHAKEYSANYSHENKHCKKRELSFDVLNFYNLGQNSLKQDLSHTVFSESLKTKEYENIFFDPRTVL